MDNMDDSQLLNQLRAGDDTAFDALFKKYYKFLLATAYSIIRNEEESKDLVQGLFIDVWEKKMYVHLNGEVKSYFYRSITNRCLNQLKRNSILKQKSLNLSSIADWPIEEFECQEPRYNQIEYALAQMPMQKRTAVNLVYIEDKKYAEAAADMGISINSLKTHLKSGLKILRSKLSNV